MSSFGARRWSAITRGAAATVAAFALVVAIAPVASAELELPPDGDQDNTGTPPPAEGGTKTGNAGGCNVVSSPSFLGLTCGAITAGQGRTVREILGDDPVPDCWHEPMTQRELDELGYENTPGPDGHRWFWERCLSGIDRETKRITGPIEFSISPVAIPNDREPTRLTDNQQELIDFTGSDDQGVPDPVAISSPTARPRVWSWVSFFNKQKYAGSDDSVGTVVSVVAGAVELRARLVRTEVFPEGYGAGRPVVECQGDGVLADRGDTPENTPEGCWHRYEQSSADQDETVDGLPAYPVDIRASWVVELSVAGGPFTEFNRFSKINRSPVAVTEVQSIVVN